MKDIKPIAIYFPQLHAIKENDEWWGEGFTDWDNVKTAKPLYDGHYQPRIPLNHNYYDQSDVDVIRSQVELAKKYGIYGFCHYHYWFDGKQLLETPTNLMLDNPDIDMPFCLSWANETWSRRWDGSENQILIKQTHPPLKENWDQHFDYLIKAWTDDRAIKVDGKPLFAIYRPYLINEIDQMLDYWREKAHQHGLDGLYIVAQKFGPFVGTAKKSLKSFDAAFQFMPSDSLHSSKSAHSPVLRLMYEVYISLPESVKNIMRNVRAITEENKVNNAHTIYDYDDVWMNAIKAKSELNLVTFPGAYVDWDNTARYKNRARIHEGASPERFQYWMEQLVKSMPDRNLPENFIFINAWNEWAEGAYLEPDEKYGYANLEALVNALKVAK